MDKNKEFEKIAKEIIELHLRKDEDYGDSFGKTFKELGVISAVTRLNDKMNRINSLVTNGSRKVNYESLEDNLLDMAAYSIMTLVELRLKKH